MDKSVNTLNQERGRLVVFIFIIAFAICFFFTGLITHAQSLPIPLHGNFETNIQYYNPDSAIGAPAVPEKLLANSFLNVIYSNENISAGFRYESYLNTLQGFDSRYNGNGFAYRYFTYTKNEIEITAGNIYEQFGNGLVLRTYNDWGLGFDNSLDGFRVKYNPIPGLYLKGVMGKQRFFFSHGPGIVRGADMEINLNELLQKFSSSKTQVILGGSAVSKFQPDQDPIYKLPENVGAAAGRLNIIRGKINAMAEVAYKINDPSLANGYIYKDGHAGLLSVAYSQKGLGASLILKRVDNMSFRSDRTASGNNLLINYLPAGTRQHTYSLAAYYPYATQPNGEMGVQAELVYKLKKGSLLGGKDGAGITVNYSKVNGIDTVQLKNGEGYTSDVFTIGKNSFFEDINVEITKPIGNDWKVILMYQNLVYNKDVVQGLSGYGTVYANVFIADVTWELNEKHALRSEMQYLSTKQDEGDWAMALVEYTFAPHWYVTVLDQYNFGNEYAEKRLHYYTGSVGYTRDVTRIMVGYGRQRAGVFCVGGVCRNVPATNGFSCTITSSF